MLATESYPYKTQREYYEDTYKFKSTASVIDIIQTEDEKREGKYEIVLDKTIFHP